ncbi:hypothetical protein CENSYa_0856 [Cenarchaeum symbiosum A]|uniref:Uncharacterized protein n=1 Tax=Cenarchaeum symbiosum (strain A) TaxID=414004 RepID=A0RVX2_CENSY|nr:hypothetical protein CENSYa_0856 [Cenarchaeum symbiosum A]
MYDEDTRGHRMVVPQLVLGEFIHVIIEKSEYPDKPSRTREKPEIKEKQKKPRNEPARITEELNRLEEMLYKMRKFHVDLKYMPVLDSNAAVMQVELMSHDRYLTPTDAGIVAIALNDVDSLNFITLDDDLYKNTAIAKYDERLVDEGRRTHRLNFRHP